MDRTDDLLGYMITTHCVLFQDQKLRCKRITSMMDLRAQCIQAGQAGGELGNSTDMGVGGSKPSQG